MKKYSLKALQMAYLPFVLKQEGEGEQCVYCWNKGCGCDSDSVKSDPFINMTEELQYA